MVAAANSGRMIHDGNSGIAGGIVISGGLVGISGFNGTSLRFASLEVGAEGELVNIIFLVTRVAIQRLYFVAGV